MDKYLDDEEFEKFDINSQRSHRRPRKQQTQMDEFLFKSRRIDKGSREFGLKTVGEPVRGSKKKRESTDKLEMFDVEIRAIKKRKKERQEREMEENNRKIAGIELDWRSDKSQGKILDDDTDFSYAFMSPSPRRTIGNRKKTTKITKFMEFSPKRSHLPSTLPPSSPSLSVTSNNPSAYQSNSTSFLNSTLDSTILRTPPRTLMETIPLSTPSPAKKRKIWGEESPIFKHLGKDYSDKRADKRSDKEFRKTFEKKKIIGNLRMNTIPSENHSSSAPEGSSSSFQYTPDEDCEIIEKPRHHRTALSAEASQREVFGQHVSDRKEIMRKLIVDKQFLNDRENGGIEKRKAELKDGQVIRNKEMRKNLMHGTDCKCCRGYYDGLQMDEKERKEYVDKVSRHRYVHQALPDTPEKYWDLTLGPCDDLEVPEENRNWEKVPEKKGKDLKKTGIQNW